MVRVICSLLFII